jgi:NADH-quinone oxidoreductase subunit B
MGIEGVLKEGFVTTSMDAVINWSKTGSLWPMTFGLACCAVEMMHAGAARYDIDRFGMLFRPSPRQSDLMIVSGRISIKMMPVLIKIWEQMPEPKYCISMGACASCGGIFDTYTMIQGVDHFIPVDVYVPGCPPRPESLIDAVLKVQEIVEQSRYGQVGARLGG